MGSSLSIISLTSHLPGNLSSDFLNGCSSGHLPRKQLWMRDHRSVLYLLGKERLNFVSKSTGCMNSWTQPSLGECSGGSLAGAYSYTEEAGVSYACRLFTTASGVC